MKIYEILSETGYPVSKDSFPSGHEPGYPFVVYETPYSDNKSADNTSYIELDRYLVRFHNKGRTQDQAKLKVLTDILKAHEIAYEKTYEDYNSDEDHTETILEFNYYKEEIDNE